MKTRSKLEIPGTDVQLGDRARCKVTGFEGIVTGHGRHLTGCDNVWIERDAGGDKPERLSRYVDVNAVELVERNPIGVVYIPPTREVPPAG